MTLHNVLILSAYLLMGAALFQGFPWRLAWPGFLTLPIGLFQIWQMNQIAAGEKPRWTLLTFTALILFGMTAYFLTLAFWTS
jgi:1,4-dihydroxy-2-naphthoate octaprenyltransferase